MFTGGSSVALLTATARAVVTGFFFSLANVSSANACWFPSPERGIRTFGDLNPGSPFHGGHRYCHNGGMAFSRLYGGGLGRPRASRRPWGPRTPSRPPSRPARKAPGCRVKMLWSMGSAPFGGSDEIVIAAGPQLDPARRRARGARERALRPPHVPHRGAAPTCGVAWARVSPIDYAAAATAVSRRSTARPARSMGSRVRATTNCVLARSRAASTSNAS